MRSTKRIAGIIAFNRIAIASKQKPGLRKQAGLFHRNFALLAAEAR
jgi:hypothetical protein